MSASSIVVTIGMVVAVAGTGFLAARCARTPRLYLAMWTLALAGLAVGLAAQALGYFGGYSTVLFRAMELGAQAVAPLGLSLGLVEVVGRSAPARFVMRLAVAAVTIVAVVILGSDPLNGNVAFGKAWPDPAVFYGPVPRLLLEYLLVPLAAITAVLSAVVAALRSRRGPRDALELQPVTAAAVAALAVALPVLAWLGSRYAGIRVPLPPGGLFALTGSLAAALTWYAGMLAARRDLVAGAGTGPADLPEDDDWAQHRLDALDGFGAGRFGPGPRSGNPGTPAGGYAGAGTADHDDDPAAAYVGDPGQIMEYLPAEPRPAGTSSAPAASVSHLPPAVQDAHARLFGQIAIYTLAEDQSGEFDRLTERVVAQVAEREPDTLVYIVHQVPTAPLQRILYEVYRDRAAFDEHSRRSYIVRYHDDLRYLVLAANVIELGLQQAKVSPLPSISEILSESGVDLTGVTRSPGGAAPPAARGHPGPRARPPWERDEVGHRDGAAPDPGYGGRYYGGPDNVGWDNVADEDPRYR